MHVLYRNIVCFKKVIDVSKNISSLALKEIHLERCTVFRLDLPNSKTMAVRSRPNKTIGQTLGPILSKYQMELKKMIVHVVSVRSSNQVSYFV